MPQSPMTVVLSIAVLALGTADTTVAQNINSGEASGAYHSNFCPRIEAELTKAQFQATCKTSQGTIENLKRVMVDPRQIGFGQLDILALAGALTGTPAPITVMRRDDAKECLFAVTRNKDVGSYGDFAANADKLRFILPPAESGSFGTFRTLKSIDPQGIGRAATVIHAASTDEAIRQALSADDTVTLFVQFPDPDNARFRMVTELGGHFVPVIDRAILRHQVGDEKIYFAQETQVANASWSKGGVSVITACTPLAVFTGHLERVTGERAKQEHRDLITTVRAIGTDVLLPPESGFTRFLRRTRELSATSAEQMVKLSEDARERAKPLFERAKDVSTKALEAAKPALERASEKGRELIEKAKDGAREIYEKGREATKPADEKPAEPKR